jgi:hypothetical protein
MSRRKEPEACYPCSFCGHEQTFPSDELMWYENELWCQACYDNIACCGKEVFTEFYDLEPFTPQLEAENAELKARNAELESLRASAQKKR